MEITFHRLAQRDVRKIKDRADVARVMKAIHGLPGGDVVAVVGSSPWLRLRVGNRRVVFVIDEESQHIYVQRVIPRGELEQATKRLPEFDA